ncbi:MAG: hypothetical protein U0Z44_03090 [Kouleothrix sp.]
MATLAEIEARDTMLHMGIDITMHRARSLAADLAAQAALLIAIDQGTAPGDARFPADAARIVSPGTLATPPARRPTRFACRSAPG